MQLTEAPIDVAIVGAGITGLLLAQQCQQCGLSVVLLDKGKSVGGRLATRRGKVNSDTPEAMPIRWDHGAQYFSAHSRAFQKLVENWHTQGWIEEWKALSTPNHPRWVAKDGMSAFCKQLARGLSVHCNQRVISIHKKEATWQIRTESNHRIEATQVVLTAPIPQITELLAQSDLSLMPPQQSLLTPVQYSPCLALMGIVHQADNIANGFLKFQDHPVLSWVANNTLKGISNPACAAITAHASPQWSHHHWNTPDDDIITLLINALTPWIAREAWQRTQLKRWKYALVTQAACQPFAALTQHTGLWAAGDGFVGGSVEGSVLSALALSQQLKQTLAQKVVPR